MSELETLTKTLIQVISALQELVAKKSFPEQQQKQQKQQNTPVKLSKPSQMTYSQFITKALADKKPIQITSKKASYRLQQDLQLLQQLSQHNIISIKTFQQIARSKKINRSAQSLKSRYHDYLYKIQEKDMRKIVQWIEKEGLVGFLIFDNNEMRIQHRDPKQSSDRKRERIQNIAKQNIQINKCKKLQNELEQKVDKIQKIVHSECTQLSETLRIYSKMTKIPIKTLSQKLDQLSGDLEALDKYLETKDSKMLWTAQEDQILKKQGIQQQILRRYRGQANVQTRKKYLRIA